MADTKDLNALLRGPLPPQEPKNEPAAVSEEVARKLVALNPALKGDGDTADFVLSMQGALDKKSTTPKEVSPLEKATNVDHLLELAQRRYDHEKRELETQISLLQSKLGSLKKRHLLEAMDHMAKLDSNLSSPLTQEALKRRKPFLDVLGFSAGSFIDRAKEKRR